MMATGGVVESVFVTGQVETDSVTRIAVFLETQAQLGSVRVVLAQRVGEMNHTVSEWPIGTELDLRRLAHDIYALAVQETQTLRESTTYGVFAFRGDAPGPAGRVSFRVETGASWMGGSSSTAPNERGVVAMLMEHSQLSARLSLGHSREIVDQYQKLLGVGTDHLRALLEQAYGRIKVLEARETEAIELREKFQSLTVQRELDHQLRLQAAAIEAEAAKRKDEMRQFAIKQAARFMPVVLAKIAGQAPPAPGPTSADTEVAAAPPGSPGSGAPQSPPPPIEALIAQLMDSLTPEQTDALTQLFRPDQLLLFVQIHQCVAARAGDGAPANDSSASAPPGRGPA